MNINIACELLRSGKFSIDLTLSGTHYLRCNLLRTCETCTYTTGNHYSNNRTQCLSVRMSPDVISTIQTTYPEYFI